MKVSMLLGFLKVKNRATGFGAYPPKPVLFRYSLESSKIQRILGFGVRQLAFSLRCGYY